MPMIAMTTSNSISVKACALGRCRLGFMCAESSKQTTAVEAIPTGTVYHSIFYHTLGGDATRDTSFFSI